MSLVCTGNPGLSSAAEDVCCAEYIRSGPEGRASDFAAMVEKIRGGSGRRFFDPAPAEVYPPEDFRLCVELDRFAFVLKAGRQGGHLCLRPSGR